MGKRRKSDGKFRVAERRGEETIGLARKLVLLRGHLTRLIERQQAGASLTDAQKAEAKSLIASIHRIKETLVKRGVHPRLIGNSEGLLESLNAAQRKRNTLATQSGGVGLYSLGKCRKLWN